MVIMNIYGGLGNQMFQYALGRSLSINRNTELKIDVTPFDNYILRDFVLPKFNTVIEIAGNRDLRKYKLINRYIKFILRKVQKVIPFVPHVYFEKQEFIYDQGVFNSKAEYFLGYWQSYKYFISIRDVLLKEFQLKEPLDQVNDDLLVKILNSNSVSLHVRRGDYLQSNKYSKGHAMCSIQYYESAISHISSKQQGITVFIFSDDIQWVKENLMIKYPSIYVDHNNGFPERDLILMKHCKHNIIANSTFSWWGAWLNENKNKIIVAPRKWMNNMNSTPDLMEKNWVLI